MADGVEIREAGVDGVDGSGAAGEAPAHRKTRNYGQKRILRRRLRAYHGFARSVRESLDSLISTEPTSALCAINGGRDGISDVDLLRQAFGPFGNVVYTEKIPGRSYALIGFDCIESASKARDALHEKPCPLLLGPGNDELLFVEFVSPSLLGRDVSTPGDASQVPGLVFVENFITESEEAALLAELAQSPWETLKGRRVQHYGYRFNYKTNTFDLSEVQPLPPLCGALARRAYEQGLTPSFPDQLTVNEYSAGGLGGIAGHVDTHSGFDDGIVSVSMCGDTVIDFRHRDGRHVPVVIPRFSVFVMTGESRYDWTHAIIQRKYDLIGDRFRERGTRTSLTYRKVRTGPCCCSYPALCDTALQNRSGA